MKRSDLPLIVLDLRQAALRLAHPCHCGHRDCTIGDHLWRSTLDMRPGPRATTTDPRVTGSAAAVWQPPGPELDPAADLAATYRARLHNAWRAARDLLDFLEQHRPDRWAAVARHVERTSDDDWCSNHLDLRGTCVPRYRGDLCRFCYDVQLAEGVLPDRPLLRRRDEGRKITELDLADLRRRVRATNPKRPAKRKRKRAS